MIVAWAAAAASAGTWTLREKLVTEVRPPFSRWTSTVAESTWVVDWTPGESTMTATLCQITTQPVAGARSQFPKVRTSRDRPVQFDGQTFDMGPTFETLGDADDDADGNPGISIQISHPRIGSGSAFVRQSARMQWSGQQQQDGRITGTVSYEPEQDLLGATTWWLKVATPQRAATGSTFELVPSDASTTCDVVAP